MANQDEFPPLSSTAKGPIVQRGFTPMGQKHTKLAVVPEERYSIRSTTNGSGVNDKAEAIRSTTNGSAVNHTAEAMQDGKIHIICAKGDLILEVSDHESSSLTVLCRVSKDALCRESPYFRALLHPSKFSEGIETERSLDELLKEYQFADRIPTSELPRVSIKSIGDMSLGRRAELTTVIVCSLQLIHGTFTSAASTPPASLVGMMSASIYFGTFNLFRDALAMTPNTSKTRWSRTEVRDEIHLRQKLLLGIRTRLRFDLISELSFKLAIEGSDLRLGERDYEDWVPLVEPLMLPDDIEEEIAFRRHAILKVISLLQAFVLRYFRGNDSFGIRCRFASDNSYQCDVFHFGQAVRFFDRLKTLKIYSAIASETKIDKLEEPMHVYDDFIGNIKHLIQNLKSAPTQQIDRNHSHCGIRQLIIPGLELVQSLVTETNVGLCLECWKDPARRAALRWQAPAALRSIKVNLRNNGHLSDEVRKFPKLQRRRCGHGGWHVTAYQAMEFFTAENIIWDY